MPKAFLFLRTLELMKATGHFYHFFRETGARAEYNNYLIEQVTLEMENRGEKVSKARVESDCADFTDSILMETFVLFLYSLAMCAGCILLELAIRHFGKFQMDIPDEPVQCLVQRDDVLFVKCD